MEKRIELELRGRQPSEVTELNLDNCRATSIAGLSDEFTALQGLSMINVGLTSLKGLPSLPSLRRLEVSENRISGNLECLHNCPELSYLNLSGNKIKDIETLAPLNELKKLEMLDLFNCEVANAENYRQDVFKVLPQLRYLDGFDAKGEEIASDDEDDLGDEGAEDSGDDGVEDEGSEVGLEYLESSNVMQDEDETEDFTPDEDESNEASAHGTKRKREETEDEQEEEGDEEEEEETH
ncbi:hypothetical protein AB6A40_010560 [Gnathostoma spinigerum]|uniref:Acidic leucine-rich nuclear phosphoprotein 32 family member A n=1 Tax=Gnathostoma spinigerum TaxID=75299 RepID=A0ABD6EWX6_9BILA